MLDAQTFKSVIENIPLVSIDLCFICNCQILLGKRRNESLKGIWFTPGGRIHENESRQGALLRIAEVELGLSAIEVEDFALIDAGWRDIGSWSSLWDIRKKDDIVRFGDVYGRVTS
jgi:colanic acid biosynthesis protein WcaH